MYVGMHRHHMTRITGIAAVPVIQMLGKGLRPKTTSSSTKTHSWISPTQHQYQGLIEGSTHSVKFSASSDTSIFKIANIRTPWLEIRPAGTSYLREKPISHT